MQGDADPENIHNGVYRADFVEMNLLGADTVYGGFGLGQATKDLLGGSLGRGG